MGRLINTEDLPGAKWVHLDTAWERGWNAAIDAILEAATTVDAVPVVRCKDCKHYYGNHTYCANDVWSEDDGFCYFGERRTDEE